MSLASPFGNLFVSVQDRIKTAVTSVKWIDQDFGQLDYNQNEYRPTVLFPCTLIDITGWSFEDLGNGLQKGTGNVVLRFATAPFSNSNQATPTPQKEKALVIYEIEYLLAKALHNWQPEGFDKLLRRNQDGEKRDDSIRERVLVFATGYIDDSASPARTIVSRPDPVVGSDNEI